MSTAAFDLVKATYERWLDLRDDPMLIRMVFGAAVANDLDGLPVWVMIIGPPGAGKSELLMGLSSSTRIHTVSQINPASLLSGYQDGTSLLPQLNGKVMVIKDLSAVTEGNAEMRNMVFSFLRDAYDGKFERATGKGEIRWEGKFGILAGGTNSVEQGRRMEGMLGERFLQVRTRIRAPDLIRIVTKHANEKTKMRDQIKLVVASLLDHFDTKKEFKGLDSEVIEYVEHVATALAKIRTAVSRDRYTREIDFPVEQGEVPTRLFEQILMWLSGMSSLGANDDELIAACERILADNIPFARAKVLSAMAEGETKIAGISAKIGLSTQGTRRVLEELVFLKSVSQNGQDYEIEDLVIERAFTPVAKP